MIYSKPSQYNKEIKLSTDGKGYYIFFDKKHPLSNNQGRVYFHRHVASVKMGKWIESMIHVHHKDGNKKNNEPYNIEILSREDHTKLHSLEKYGIKEEIHCSNCNKKFLPNKKSTSCCSNKCRTENGRLFNVSKLELEKLIWEMPTTKVCKMFNVSDVAISKRCKLFNITKPPRGYWTKQEYMNK